MTVISKRIKEILTQNTKMIQNIYPSLMVKMFSANKKNLYISRKNRSNSSSETQGQIVGARESLNRRKNMAQKKSKEKHKFSGTNQKTERRRPFGTGLVRHCPQGLFSPFFTFLRALFFRPNRLSIAPAICPWVSEDGYCVDIFK